MFSKVLIYATTKKYRKLQKDFNQFKNKHLKGWVTEENMVVFKNFSTMLEIISYMGHGSESSSNLTESSMPINSYIVATFPSLEKKVKACQKYHI